MSEIDFNSPSGTAVVAQPTAKPAEGGAFGVDSDFDLMHYYRLLLRNSWKIILFSVVVSGFTALYALSLTPIYFANTSILIETQQPNILSFQDVYQVDTRNRKYFGTQLQILKSRALATRVVERLDLTRHSVFDLRQTPTDKPGLIDLVKSFFGKGTKDDDEAASVDELVAKSSSEPSLELFGDSSVAQSEQINQAFSRSLNDNESGLNDPFEQFIKKRTVDSLMSSVIVFPLRGTSLVNIGYSASDPVLAANIANAFADVYIESQLEAKLEATQKASAWLSGRLGDLRQSLRSSEVTLQEFREREKLVDIGDVRSIDVAELEQLTQSLVDATSKKGGAQTLYRQMAGGSLPLDRLLALPIVSNNIVVQSLIERRGEAKRKVAELSKRYLEKHPQMLSALSDVSQVERELRIQVDNVASGVEINFLAAKDAENSLRRQIAEVRKRLQTVNRKEFTLRELEREVEANRQVYEVFLNRGKETNEAGSLETVNARVIDEALPPDYAAKPEKKKIVAVALLFSAAFAAFIVLLLDFLDNTIKTPEDVEERLRVPLLGHVPLDKENKDDMPLMNLLSDEQWHFAEAIRTIRTSFILSGLESPAKVTVVTSSVPNEGKSTISLAIAQALGQMEKVLLIDADMRRPSIGKALDISLLTPGLSNLIAGTAEIEECVTRLPETEVDVVTAGVVLGNPLDQLAGDRFANVINSLRAKYDRIIIDSAPIQAVSDSIVIATHADALIYVVKSDGSTIPVIKRGLRRLSGANARFAGVVLNQVDTDKVKKTSGYEDGYYDNYGYTGPEASNG